MASEGPTRQSNLAYLDRPRPDRRPHLTQDPQAPEGAGLRITPGNEGLELMLVAEPVTGDALIDDGGARVFVEPQAAQLLDEQTLDAQVEEGKVSFFLASPDAKSSPDALDDETPARLGTTHRVRNRCPSSGLSTHELALGAHGD
jgi:iron-sulfur cluster assembly protein